MGISVLMFLGASDGMTYVVNKVIKNIENMLSLVCVPVALLYAIQCVQYNS